MEFVGTDWACKSDQGPGLPGDDRGGAARQDEGGLPGHDQLVCRLKAARAALRATGGGPDLDDALGGEAPDDLPHDPGVRGGAVADLGMELVEGDSVGVRRDLARDVLEKGHTGPGPGVVVEEEGLEGAGRLRRVEAEHVLSGTAEVGEVVVQLPV